MARKSKREMVAIILAAGKGTRMNSQMPKVLHSVCGTPMIDHVMEALRPLDVTQVYVVTGHLHEMVKSHLGNRAICVYQKDRLGTAHAVKMVTRHLSNFDGDVLVTCGDTPLIQTETLAALVARRRSHHTAGTVLTTTLEDPRGYGRVVRNRDGTVRKIVEDKDTNTYEEKIQEINAGFYCFDWKELQWALKRVSNNNAQGEFYLTDTVEILGDAGKEVEAYVAPDYSEVVGVNNRRDMAVAEKYLRTRILNQIMDSGVTIVDPSTTYIDNTVRIGIDTTIQPFTIIRGNTMIGEGCDIGPNVTVVDSRIGNNVRLLNSVMEGASADDNVHIGPYAYVRANTLLRRDARVGTFVEVARCDVGARADVLHLSYLGDAHVGEESYVGAGTMTCNFDGAHIQRTEIGNGVFLGFNNLLVAPVRIKDAARTGHHEQLSGEIKQDGVPKVPSTREARDRNSAVEKDDTPPPSLPTASAPKKSAKAAGKPRARKSTRTRTKKS
ncbi:MAG: bifunctional UDP-N-acetylglucosamine pyrophosphorylase / glucosamine-phosphate N-acetyltransferase [Candidatus Sumerlaeota bacterium]|nr:bifunctional UDP-N-acetylglucosamine pyrophosphorylase / glucosamine-phosphate N-acetyltransferase [Candidatus Sumerlaeota bacterium]